MENEIALNQESAADRTFDPSSAFQVVSDSLNKLADVATVQAVYAEPIKNGETVVVNSAEVLTVAAFGVGSGGGKGPKGGVGGGGGGGGGGRTFARPVAAIVITPDSVRVEPIVDATKIALAALTAFGFMFAMIARMSRRRAPRFNER